MSLVADFCLDLGYIDDFRLDTNWPEDITAFDFETAFLRLLTYTNG